MTSHDLQLARNIQQLHTADYFRALSTGLELDAIRFADAGDETSARIEWVRAEFAAQYAARSEEH